MFLNVHVRCFPYPDNNAMTFPILFFQHVIFLIGHLETFCVELFFQSKSFFRVKDHQKSNTVANNFEN